MRLTSLAISVLVLGAQAACTSCGDCRPARATVHIDGGCVDAWVCTETIVNAGQYEVRCTPGKDGGWASCQCFHGAIPERVIGTDGPWCHRSTPDSFERIIDANHECGWSMSLTNI